MSEQGKLETIWLKRAKLGPMDPKQSARLIAGKGLENNANIGGKRQVTIISLEAWQKMLSELGAEIDPSVRRANLLISGLELANTRGRILKIGNCRLKINGETLPCERMDQALPGLRDALSPQGLGGAFGRVTGGGEIRVGDEVWLEEERPG